MIKKAIGIFLIGASGLLMGVPSKGELWFLADPIASLILLFIGAWLIDFYKET